MEKHKPTVELSKDKVAAEEATKNRAEEARRKAEERVRAAQAKAKAKAEAQARAEKYLRCVVR